MMDMRGSRSSSRRGSDSPAQGPAAEIAGAGLSRETRGHEEGGSPQWPGTLFSLRAQSDICCNMDEMC